jgi:NAD-dependent DNA ligase
VRTFEPEEIDPDTIVEQALTLNHASFFALLKLLDDYYNNDASLIDDDIYNELVDIYEAKFRTQYKEVGAEPTGNKVPLPYFLGSLRKIKNEAEITRWSAGYPGPYIVEDKIDGLTLLYTARLENGTVRRHLYTRGGGYNGLDVSHLLTHINIPQITPPPGQELAVRGEVVMTRADFTAHGAGFKNARNLASGIVNAKKQFNPELARYLTFYAFRIVNQTNTPEQDIIRLSQMGFRVPNPVSVPTITPQWLEDYYKQREAIAPYEMDGLVVYQNVAEAYPYGESPRHVIAFKTLTSTAVTTVTEVRWHPSKDMLLKPVVHYQTVHLSGADLHKASGLNARFIVNNNVGPGAQILLTRSGATIPRILQVVTPAPGGPALPNPADYGNYTWNANGVEFVMTDANALVQARRLSHFLKTLRVKNAGPSRTLALVRAGILDVQTLLAMTPQQLAPILGPGVAQKLYTDMHAAVVNAPPARIMDASNIFRGIGTTRFEDIFSAYPNFLEFENLDPATIATYVRQVRGFNALADEVAVNLRPFMQWLRSVPAITLAQPGRTVAPRIITMTATPIAGPPNIAALANLILRPAAVAQNLSGMTIVLSGFRGLESQIEARGGRIGTSVSRNTSLVVVKDMNNLTGKPAKAQQLGIPIMPREQFEAQYLR